MAAEAHEKIRQEGGYLGEHEVFAEAFIKELATVSGKELAPYLTCKYKLPQCVYEVKIQIPARILRKI